jgi:hypothetical protein
MGKAKSFKRKLNTVLFTILLITSSIVIPLSLLIQPAGSQLPWWNENWNFREQIIIDHTKVKADLVNFPVLIDITDPDLKTKAQSDGHDIVFTIDQKTTLNHEIEFYDGNSGHLVAWIEIPFLSSAADTDLCMYYGNPSAANQQNASGVWDTSFVMVQHLEESSATRYDSTSNGNNGTAYGGIVKSAAGKIDGADVFDGINDYIRVSDSPSLNPSSAITIELWMNLSSTGSYINLVNKGEYSQYYLRLGSGEGNIYWYVKFSDGTVKYISGNIGWKWNTWHHLVATVDTQAQVMKVYLDGVEKLSGTFVGGKTIISTTNPLLISSNTRMVKGTLDEVRISNAARSPAWIQTSYNNQKDPTTFYTIEGEEVQSLAPLIFGNPGDEATGIYTNPTLSARVIDPENSTMTIVFKERAADSWNIIGIYEDVPSGTYSANATQMKNLGTTYYWSVCVNKGGTWINKTFSLTTTTKILQQKWMVETGYKGLSGVLAADVNGDGVDEVIYAGKGGVEVLNGRDGSKIWSVNDSAIGDHCQPEMADLDKDGILEIVVPLENPPGILALHANNGSTYWRYQTASPSDAHTYSCPVVFDIDGNGYPTIFFGSEDVHHGLSGSGTVTSLSHNGKVLHQTFSWRPCSGGLSIADTDGDGEFELYMGDRDMYLNSATYGDNDYGKGLVSLWAKNLTLRWYRPEIFCSSQKPMIADVNKDGKLEIIIGCLDGGLAVINATDGSTIRMALGNWQQAPTHYQPSAYDIDGDGNLEMLMADPNEGSSKDIVVWDLVKWQVDARIYVGYCFYGPTEADVTGDGAMEIIACNYGSIFIIDKTYRIIDGITGLSGNITVGGQTQNIDGVSNLGGILNYAVVQDTDGDGYNEVIVSTQWGRIYAFDTPARRPNPRPRTEVHCYSEFRLGAAEYVQPQGGPAPVVLTPYPQDGATEVGVSLSGLNFTLTDYQHDLINFTVTTYPDIGSTTEINKGNGRYVIPISNLRYSTTYTWTIKATDGTHWMNRTFTFTTQALSPWWNNAWQYRKPITIDSNKVVAVQNNFPMLMDITDADLRYMAQNDGDDIVFTDGNGNKLVHEIELYNNNSGHLVAWVKIPLISPTADKTIYMYYGNPYALNQENASAVWDSNFVMVQHLEESSATRYDSTSNRNNGTAYGGIVKSAAGKIDGADVFDGVNDYITVKNSPSLDPSSAITIELWMKLNSTGNYINLVGKGEYSQYYLRLGSAEGSVYWYVKFSDGTTKYISGSIGWKWNTWHHVVATVDTLAQVMKVYLDGVEKLGGTFAGGKTIISTTNPLLISNTNTRFVKGTLDEVRISNVARSAAWIQTSYNSEKDPTTFYTAGKEQAIPEEPVVSSPSPPNEATGLSPSLTQLRFNITDYQNDLMNYTVTTYPDIGSGTGINVNSGRFTVNISGVQYFKTYSWTVSSTDGTHWTNITFTFTTLPTEPPTQADPILIKSGGNIICYNQSTTDLDGDKVTNIYNWYRNNTSLANLLLPFDTKSTTTVKDYSGYNNDGMIIRGATWTANGKVGGAYNFNRGFIQIPGTSTLDGGGQWSEITIEHWIYLTAWESGTRTIAKIPSYEIGISGYSIFASIWIATGDSMLSGLKEITYNTTLLTNTWYHVALTYKSGVGLTLYVNGVAVATKTGISGKIQTSGSNPLYIGWFDYFKGKIDEVRIYPKSLSQQQIYQRYIETKDGLSNSSTIASAETAIGDIWRCEVTPNDSHQDGTTKTSNPITIGKNNTPIITSYYPETDPTINETQSQEFNVTCFDPDGDSLTIEWWNGTTQIKTETGVTTSSYTFDAMLGSAGQYIITAIVKDSLAQTSHQWTLTVEQQP